MLFDLIEMAAPPSHLLGTSLWHGTNTGARGLSILRDGIRHIDWIELGRSPRARQAPVPGRVYLSQRPYYAIIYALGGNMIGQRIRPEFFAKSGRYGYLFEIPGDQLTNVEPDEDSVGKAVSHCLSWGKQREEQAIRIGDSMEEPGFVPGLYADQDLRDTLRYMAHRHLTPKQLIDVRNGVYSQWAVAGKKLLRVLPDHIKVRIILLGAHVGHQGPVVPSAAWRIDKLRSEELAPDASNFFSIAERVR
jgi:hypothetical protein